MSEKNFSQTFEGNAGNAVVHAVSIPGNKDPSYVVYFDGHQKEFSSKRDALEFAKLVANEGWNDGRRPTGRSP